jgi:preprotein translocase subunit SecE
MAKQCALIAVDEMLIEYRVLMIETAFCYDQFKYWQEVKKEIEKI